jgi:hypothetical protein
LYIPKDWNSENNSNCNSIVCCNYNNKTMFSGEAYGALSWWYLCLALYYFPYPHVGLFRVNFIHPVSKKLHITPEIFSRMAYNLCFFSSWCILLKWYLGLRKFGPNYFILGHHVLIWLSIVLVKNFLETGLK